mmetsp:Transcript_24238/g.63290  ORF Transcript_24238/g.63290 Transcript_24238/m.63290 type:complete len:272 (+) Transcript_24238:318-1133(+)
MKQRPINAKMCWARSGGRSLLRTTRGREARRSLVVILVAHVCVLVLRLIRITHILVALSPVTTVASTSGTTDLAIRHSLRLGHWDHVLGEVAELHHVTETHARGVVDDKLVAGVLAKQLRAAVAGNQSTVRHRVSVGVLHPALLIGRGLREEVEAVVWQAGEILDVIAPGTCLDVVVLLFQRWVLIDFRIRWEAKALLGDLQKRFHDGLLEIEVTARQLPASCNLAEKHIADAVMEAAVAARLRKSIRKVDPVAEGGTCVLGAWRLYLQSL